jgi:hypothetical protein
MGYYTNYSDEITIDPPLSWDEILEIPEYYDEEDMWGEKDVTLDVTEERVNTSEGLLIRRTGNSIVPWQEDSYKGYDMIEHVQYIVDKFGDSHRFKGYISAEGEEAGDIWRLYVIDGEAQAVKAIIVWPEIVEPTITWPEV